MFYHENYSRSNLKQLILLCLLLWVCPQPIFLLSFSIPFILLCLLLWVCPQPIFLISFSIQFILISSSVNVECIFFICFTMVVFPLSPVIITIFRWYVLYIFQLFVFTFVLYYNNCVCLHIKHRNGFHITDSSGFY